MRKRLTAPSTNFRGTPQSGQQKVAGTKICSFLIASCAQCKLISLLFVFLCIFLFIMYMYVYTSVGVAAALSQCQHSASWPAQLQSAEATNKFVCHSKCLPTLSRRQPYFVQIFVNTRSTQFSNSIFNLTSFSTVSHWGHF